MGGRRCRNVEFVPIAHHLFTVVLAVVVFQDQRRFATLGDDTGAALELAATVNQDLEARSALVDLRLVGGPGLSCTDGVEVASYHILRLHIGRMSPRQKSKK